MTEAISSFLIDNESEKATANLSGFIINAEYFNNCVKIPIKGFKRKIIKSSLDTKEFYCYYIY